MKNNMPTNSKVGVFNYKITYIEDPDIQDVGKCYGYCDTNNNIIIMDKDLDDVKMKFYLFHEILEQINAYYELNLKHATIMQLGAYIIEYMWENPKVINFLLKKSN